MSIIPETIWHDLKPYLGKGFGEEAYIRKILFDNQKLQLDELKASNAKLRAACEGVIETFNPKNMLGDDEILYSLRRDYLPQVLAALEAVREWR